MNKYNDGFGLSLNDSGDAADSQGITPDYLMQTNWYCNHCATYHMGNCPKVEVTMTTTSADGLVVAEQLPSEHQDLTKASKEALVEKLDGILDVLIPRVGEFEGLTKEMRQAAMEIANGMIIKLFTTQRQQLLDDLLKQANFVWDNDKEGKSATFYKAVPVEAIKEMREK